MSKKKKKKEKKFKGKRTIQVECDMEAIEKIKEYLIKNGIKFKDFPPAEDGDDYLIVLK